MATRDDLIRFKGPGQVSFSAANELLSSGNDRTMEAVKSLRETVGNTVDEVESNVLAKAQQVIDSYSLADFDKPDGLAMYDMATRLDELASNTGMLDSGVTHNYAKARQKELVADKADRAELFKVNQEIGAAQRLQDQEAKTAKISEAAQATRYLSKMGTNVSDQIEEFRLENGADAELPDHLVTANAELEKRKLVYADAYANILNDPAASQNLYDTIFSTENKQEIERLKKDSWVQKLVGGEQRLDHAERELTRRERESAGKTVKGQVNELTERMSEGSTFAKALSIDPTTGAPTVNASMLNTNVEAALGVIASKYTNALDVDPARYQQQTSWKEEFGEDEQGMRRAFNSAIQDYQKDNGTKLSARQVNLLYDSVGTQGIDSTANPFWGDFAQWSGLGKNNKMFNSARNKIYDGIPEGLQNIEQFEKEGMASSYRGFFAELASDAAAINMSPEELFGTTMGIKPDNGYFDFLPKIVQTRLLNDSNTDAAGDINQAANGDQGNDDQVDTGQEGTAYTPDYVQPTDTGQSENPSPRLTDLGVAIEASNKAVERDKRKQWLKNNGDPNKVNTSPKGVPDSRYSKKNGMTLAGGDIDYAFWNEESKNFYPSKHTSDYYHEHGTPVLKNGKSMGRIKFSDKGRVNAWYTTYDLARDLGVNRGFLDFVVKAQGKDIGALPKGEWAEIMFSNYSSAVKNKKLPVTSLNFYIKRKKK